MWEAWLEVTVCMTDRTRNGLIPIVYNTTPHYAMTKIFVEL